MKIPCELIVWYVLPSIRRELARELVEKHKFTQAEVARRFGVTDAAISQYLKSKRGTNKELENSGKYEEFKDRDRPRRSAHHRRIRHRDRDLPGVRHGQAQRHAREGL